MTKKDYELFANTIYEMEKQGLKCDNAVHVCRVVFEKDNPLFQTDKFLRACNEGKHIRKSIKGEVSK